MIGSNIANFAFTLGRNKLLALYFGPTGIGWIALVNNVIDTAAVTSGMGVCDAFNRELSRRKSEHSDAEIVSSGLAIFLVSLALVIPAATILVLRTVEPRGSAIATALAFIVAALCAATWRVLSGIYLGYGITRTLFNVIFWGAVANLALAAALIFAGVTDLAAYIIMTPALLTAFGLWGIWPRLKTLVSWHKVRTLPARKPILAIALPVVGGLLLEPLTLLFLRSHTAELFGEAGVGLLQPGLLFVNLSGTLFNSFMGITVARWDQTAEPAFSKRFIGLLGASLALPLAGAVFVFLMTPLWSLLIALFFTREFADGVSAVPWLLTGEAMRMGSIFLMHTLLSRRMGYLTMLPRIACFSTAVAGVWLGGAQSIVGVAQVYMAAYGSYLALALITWFYGQTRFRRMERQQQSA